MINDDLYEDEVMRDVWERKAHISAKYGDWEEYRRRAMDNHVYSSDKPSQPFAPPRPRASA
ncbi:MAG: hypothetical protein LBS97_06870 [Treponema sp.]|jgi:hypothetical protein|nr:hypothetical protein [Treponema sp.]